MNESELVAALEALIAKVESARADVQALKDSLSIVPEASPAEVDETKPAA